MNKNDYKRFLTFPGQSPNAHAKMAHTRRYKGEILLPNIREKHSIGDIS